MNSIRTRLLLTFLFIGITPYILIVAYFSYFENSKIIEGVKESYKSKANHAKKIIENTLIGLDEEMTFISKLELLDDMISNDTDLQISRILEQKSIKAQQKYINLYALDLEHTIIASSEISMINKRLDVVEYKKEYFILDNHLYLIKNINASFDNRALGYLIARFDLKQLETYLLSDAQVMFQIGKIDNSIKSQREDDSFYYAHVALSSYLEGFEIRYIIDKDETLSYIDDFLLYLSLITLFGMIIILLISTKMTTIITKPIFALKNASREIVETKDFHLRIEPSNIDEFRALGKSFNKLFESTEQLVDRLKSENETRLKNYIGLSETFNALSQAVSYDYSIELTLRALRKNINYKISLKQDDSGVDIVHTVLIKDFTQNTDVLVGYLHVQNSALLNETEIIFINSISLMLKNQLEKLSLLEKINSASNAKTAFISSMSHELRTPLNAIIGYSQYMISYEELEDDQVDTIAKIETSAYHLLNIINDILDIAKIEAGKVDKKIVDINPYEEMKECVDIVEALAEDKGLAMIVEIEDTKDLIIQSDAKIFKQIIINLLSNAIKFTNEGSIVLRAQYEPSALSIEVKDSGIGISSKDLEKVFDEFTQLQNAKKTKEKGSGLGLSLCKHLSQEVGAHISMKSEGLDKGSTAVLRFSL